MAEERYTVARMFLAYMRTSQQLGLRGQVERTSPELAQMFAKPPLATSRIRGSLCDQLYAAVYGAQGRPAVRKLGYESMKLEGMQLIGSLVQNTFALFGNDPGAIFSNLGVVMEPIVGNVELGWTPHGERGGTVSIRPKGQPAPLAYAVYEGYFEYFLEAAGAQGMVEDAMLATDALSATIAVRW